MGVDIDDAHVVLLPRFGGEQPITGKRAGSSAWDSPRQNAPKELVMTGSESISAGIGASIHPSILVVFGPTGDLMARKVVPALFYLRGKGQLPEKLRVVGFGRREWGDDDLREHVRGILAERASGAEPGDIEDFLALSSTSGEFQDGDAYQETRAHLSRFRRSGACAPTSSSTLPFLPPTTRSSCAISLRAV
jgi:hypothetical protein